MTEFKLAGGVVIDVATGEDLDAAKAELGDMFARSHADSMPIYQTRFAAAVTPGAGATTTVLKFGRPRSGRIWNLVYLTITGPDDRTAVAGASSASYVGNPDDPSLHGLINPANGVAVPNSASWSKDEIWVHDNEELFVIVYGAPINTQLSAVARVHDHRAQDREATRI